MLILSFTFIPNKPLAPFAKLASPLLMAISKCPAELNNASISPSGTWLSATAGRLGETAPVGAAMRLH